MHEASRLPEDGPPDKSVFDSGIHSGNPRSPSHFLFATTGKTSDLNRFHALIPAAEFQSFSNAREAASGCFSKTCLQSSQSETETTMPSGPGSSSVAVHTGGAEHRTHAGFPLVVLPLCFIPWQRSRSGGTESQQLICTLLFHDVLLMLNNVPPDPCITSVKAFGDTSIAHSIAVKIPPVQFSRLAFRRFWGVPRPDW